MGMLLNNDGQNQSPYNTSQVAVTLAESVSEEQRLEVMKNLGAIAGVREVLPYSAQARPGERMYKHLNVSLESPDESGTVCDKIAATAGVVTARFATVYRTLGTKPPSPSP